MIVHKILRGPSAARYLPFGLSRLRALARIAGPNGSFSQKYRVGGGAYLVWVKQFPPFQYVSITEAGVGYFEFFTSGKPVETYPVTSGGLTANVYKTAVVSVSFGARGLRAEIREHTRHENAADGSLVERPQQVDLVDEPVCYPGKRKGFASYDHMLYSSWAPNHAHSGLNFRCYNMQGYGPGMYNNRGHVVTHFGRDIGVDVPFQDSQGLQPIRQAFITDDPADWPREGALRRVESDTWGTRDFGVLVDAFNQFHVFPLSSIGPVSGDDQNVPPLHVQMAQAVFPSWAYEQSQRFKDWYAAHAGGAEQYGLIDFPDVDWRLNPAGTRACAIVYERVQAIFDNAYYSVGVGSNPMTPTDFDDLLISTGYAARHFSTFDPSYEPTRYVSAPGLLEVDINITLTGANPQDFTLALVVHETRRPTTTPYCTFVAGYSFVDIKAPDWTETNQHYRVRVGDLVALDIERYYRDNLTYSFFSLKNLQAPRAGELRTFDCQALVDYDLPTLSFAFRMSRVEVAPKVLATRTGAPVPGFFSYDYQYHHPCINVFTLLRQRRLLFPDSMPAEIRASLEAVKDVDARAVMADAGGGFTLMALGDTRDWTDTELGNLRNYFAENVLHHKVGTGYTTPSTALLNWWQFAMTAYFPPSNLLYIDEPRFGWYVYSDEIINRLHVTPHSTFFVHPGGTWAFYDCQYIYNRNGMFGPVIHDALTPFTVDLLEHCIFDHVSLASVSGRGRAIGTSFIELYNKAVQAGIDAGNLIGTWQLIDKPSIRTTFTKGTYTEPTTGVQWLDLRIDWYGTPSLTAYYQETGYQGGAWYSGPAFANTGGLMDGTLGMLFTSAPGYGGFVLMPQYTHRSVKFSTCLLIQ